MQGDNYAAEKSLAKACKLGPDNATHWYAYGDILRILEKYDEAIPAYRKALEIDPEHPKAENKLGLALFNTGQLDDAEVVLSSALRKEPKNPYPYFNLGMVYSMGGKNRLAIGAFEKFLELAPKQDGDVPVAKKKLRELRKRLR
jgi:tetratricopeptide (TPR) repeat protein